ncbi:MAG: transcriptional regulator MraZ [Jatrophihabitans sp.]|nr:MAG: transcriptional regulator MraZ [Jatrophihabitans sp.]
MFLGTHTPRLDDKGRIALPARFRPALEGGLVICKGQERCLYVFPSVGFTEFTRALSDAPFTDPRVREYSRTLYASASPETPDGQGRITVPAMLRAYAGLAKDCVVAGVNTHVEIWDATAWAVWSERADKAFAEIAGEVLPGVF